MCLTAVSEQAKKQWQEINLISEKRRFTLNHLLSRQVNSVRNLHKGNILLTTHLT